MTNEQWMTKHSAKAARFHYGDGGNDLRKYLVGYLSEAILSLRSPIQGMDDARRNRLRARMVSLRDTLRDKRTKTKQSRRAPLALVELRAEQAQQSANGYGAWERDDVPFLDFSKMPGISNTGKNPMV